MIREEVNNGGKRNSCQLSAWHTRSQLHWRQRDIPPPAPFKLCPRSADKKTQPKNTSKLHRKYQPKTHSTCTPNNSSKTAEKSFQKWMQSASYLWWRMIFIDGEQHKQLTTRVSRPIGALPTLSTYAESTQTIVAPAVSKKELFTCFSHALRRQSNKKHTFHHNTQQQLLLSFFAVLRWLLFSPVSSSK